MKKLRDQPLMTIGGDKVDECKDYSKGIDGLPKSDVLKYFIENGSSIVIRPSGTEPKLKAYISVVGKGKMNSYRKIVDELLG